MTHSTPPAEPPAKWRKIGWRSIKHRGFPALIVRFNTQRMKPKFLDSASAAIPPQALAALLQSATEFWQQLKSKEQHERNSTHVKQTSTIPRSNIRRPVVPL